MRLVGPNWQGLANFGSGAVASFSTMFLEAELQDGPVGIVSQSGIMSVVPYGWLRERGIGVRQVHATGNDADVGLLELALAVVRDPQVRVLILYMEGFETSTLWLGLRSPPASGECRSSRSSRPGRPKADARRVPTRTRCKTKTTSWTASSASTEYGALETRQSWSERRSCT
jgi:hypothetical protein